MTEASAPSASETDLALISFARVVLDILYAADVARPSEIDPLLELHQTQMVKMGYPTAAGILGTIRQLANHSDSARQREELRTLMRARPKGSA